jgi:uncharacterized protein YcfJ
MKPLLLILSTLTLFQSNAFAFEAIATVVNSSPITKSINRPTQQCWTETEQVVQPAQPSHNGVGAIIGGVVGGLLGNTVGHGNGRVAGAAVGAGVGALTGDTIANQNSAASTTAAVPVQRCRQVDNLQTVITGYVVTYEFDGQRFSARLPNNPGSQLRVNVAVTPK